MQTDLQETSRFLVRNEKYYSREFLAIERKIKSLRPNFGALLAGPLWAAARASGGFFG